MATIAAKLGMAKQVEPPKSDDRTEQWVEFFNTAHRGRPYDNGPLPLPPLDLLDLADRLRFPAEPMEIVGVVGEMDHEWLEWARK